VRISPQQLQSLGRAIVDALVRADLVELGGGNEAAGRAVTDRFEAYFKARAALEGEAERLAEEHLRSAGGRSGSGGLDRHRVVEMIKEKLAAQRNFPL
jgi:hypothetical protein